MAYTTVSHNKDYYIRGKEDGRNNKFNWKEYPLFSDQEKHKYKRGIEFGMREEFKRRLNALKDLINTIEQEGR
jgi:hypothetical protein